MKYELTSVDRDKQNELWYTFTHKVNGAKVKVHTDDYQSFISRNL